MTRDDLASILADTQKGPYIEDRASFAEEAAAVLAALEGHAVIDGQIVALERAEVNRFDPATGSVSPAWYYMLRGMAGPRREPDTPQRGPEAEIPPLTMESLRAAMDQAALDAAGPSARYVVDPRSALAPNEPTHWRALQAEVNASRNHARAHPELCPHCQPAYAPPVTAHRENCPFG